ncbi:unnamed protein product [Phytophthora lilii]|uniref:Unnamed protein product n=1 Tax=Phytophthora lilii TaxID=2077276 RepID=A0A9W6X752_9STRA|nr:unnamed protein product [Phytophthora lilii]
MKPSFISVVLASVVSISNAASIDHNKVQPIPQPEAVTNSEKAAVKFKPQLYIETGCASYPAVNAGGETSGGLKGTNGDDACKVSLLASQVYGRATWYQGVWAIMYAWYFPKRFWNMNPSNRHDWANFVVWIDNPAVDNPKILGVSFSKSEKKYDTQTQIYEDAFVGYRVLGTRSNRSYQYGSNSSMRVQHSIWATFGPAFLEFSLYTDGDYQDLIMWEQMTDEVRAALVDSNFDDFEVPFNEDNFNAHLEKAWPF